jgi:hypothetical protein
MCDPALLGSVSQLGRHILGGIGAVMHEEHIDVLEVVDEERLVSGGYQVARLLVGAVSDLAGPS